MREFIIALQFLTRINIIKNLSLDENNYAKAFLYFPLVGLIIGGFLTLIAYSSAILFSKLTTGVLVISGGILLTGGLHLDGFMDCCDGLLSGRPREKALEIMKDSRVGSMGVLGILILLSLKLVFIIEVIMAPSQDLYPVLLIMPLFGRWAMVYVMSFFPYARPQGLGTLFRQGISPISFWVVSLYSGLLAGVILPAPYLMVIILAAASTALVAMRIHGFLGGHTGDTYGAICEMSEVFFLFWYMLINKFY